MTTTRRDILKVRPVRQHLDGSDYYTLPVLHDPTTGSKVGDSFDIALYLDKQYPDSKRVLIPSGSEASMRKWNAMCDAVFSGTNNTWGSIGLLYAHGLPFNPETAEVSRRKFVDTVPGMEKWDDFNLVGEARERALEGFRGEMRELAGYFNKGEEGPYLEGKVPTYADFIVGGWLKFLSVCLPEWEQVKTWDDGVWLRLLEVLERDYGEEK